MEKNQETQAYDKIFKENIQSIILPFALKFLDIKDRRIEQVSESLNITTAREVDFLAKVFDKDATAPEYLLHLEFQTRQEKDMVLRMQEYHGIIQRKYKYSVKSNV